MGRYRSLFALFWGCSRFFLAFRESLLQTRGGLQLLVLDDPQELLDAENRQRLADAIPQFVESKCQLILTSHDADFSRLVANCGKGKFVVDHRAVWPVCTNRPTLLTPLALDCLLARRDKFEHPDNQNIDGPAQDYAAEYRVFLESRLGDFFEEPAFATGSRKPTLGDFLSKIRSKRSSGFEFFSQPAVTRFCDHNALRDGSELLNLLNKAHHRDKDTIRFIDVDCVKSDMKAIQSLLLDIHEEYRRWQKREDTTVRVISPRPLQLLKPPTVSLLPIFSELAASTAYDERSSSQPIDEVLGEDWFQDKAIFRVASHSLGWSAPMGSIVIVEAEAKQVEDKRLVVALVKDRILARRLAYAYDDRTKIALVAESTDPTKRPPSRLLPATAVQLHKIVGVLFDPFFTPTRTQDEAIPIEEAGILRKLKMAFRIRDNSALPLALSGQLVLGGSRLTATDFSQRQGAFAAVALKDGTNVFKRVSHALPGSLAHIYKFESIGGLGDSLLAAIEEVEGETAAFPVVEDAIEILGVLYN